MFLKSIRIYCPVLKTLFLIWTLFLCKLVVVGTGEKVTVDTLSVLGTRQLRVSEQCERLCIYTRKCCKYSWSTFERECKLFGNPLLDRSKDPRCSAISTAAKLLMGKCEVCGPRSTCVPTVATTSSICLQPFMELLQDTASTLAPSITTSTTNSYISLQNNSSTAKNVSNIGIQTTLNPNHTYTDDKNASRNISLLVNRERFNATMMTGNRNETQLVRLDITNITSNSFVTKTDMHNMNNSNSKDTPQHLCNSNDTHLTKCNSTDKGIDKNITKEMVNSDNISKSINETSHSIVTTGIPANNTKGNINDSFSFNDVHPSNRSSDDIAVNKTFHKNTTLQDNCEDNNHKNVSCIQEKRNYTDDKDIIGKTTPKPEGGFLMVRNKSYSNESFTRNIESSFGKTGKHNSITVSPFRSTRDWSTIKDSKVKHNGSNHKTSQRTYFKKDQVNKTTPNMEKGTETCHKYTRKEKRKLNLSLSSSKFNCRHFEYPLKEDRDTCNRLMVRRDCGPCSCVTGYHYQSKTGRCVKRCRKYGAEFQLQAKLYCIAGHNDKKFRCTDVEVCKKACATERGFTCRSLDHWSGVCYLSKETKLEVPPRHWSPWCGCVHYQRMCKA